jgi:hypothetical protein
MSKPLNIGDAYGSWVVVGGKWSRPLCRCVCGSERVVVGYDLRTGKSKSCGCLNIERIRAVGKSKKRHGFADTPTQTSWVEMRRRCYSKHRKEYPNYGGRGITVCERWLNSFDNFLSDMGPKPAGTTIERRDNNGNYCPENCYWADRKTQERNKRSNAVYEFYGVKMTVAEASEKFGINYQTLWGRIRRGLSPEQAVSK